VTPRHRVGLLALLLVTGLATGVTVASSQPAVTLRVFRAGWGSDPSAPGKAYPEDTGATLTVEAENYSNTTIKGVTATLFLADTPFIDPSGGDNASTLGVPVISEPLSPTDEIQPGSFFTLTFTLDLDPNAVPQTYAPPLVIDYLANSTQGLLSGQQTLSVSVAVSKLTSATTCTVAPAVLEQGATVTIDGTIDQDFVNETITFVFTAPNTTLLSRTLTTRTDGSYHAAFQPDREGIWTLNASWAGDARYAGSWASTSFDVRHPVTVRVDPSVTHLTADRTNTLTFTLTNDGDTRLYALDAAVQLPAAPTTPVTPTASSPLILYGEDQWRVELLSPGNTTELPVTLFVPLSAQGTTATVTVTADYRDDYGESHSDTFNLGFTITGWIDLLVYERTTIPTPVQPGADLTLTATVLNRGNTAARYANATLLVHPVLIHLTESTSYIGEVDADSPTPFTVIARVRADTADGVYPITLTLSYRDDHHHDHTLNVTIPVTVEFQEAPTVPPPSLLDALLELLWVWITLVAASVAILYLYRRHARRIIP
jgi:hypothetical protein